MDNQFSRTEMLLGKENVEKLHNIKIAIFGIGGVGSFVLEGLVRAGIQNFILVDKDEIDITNINRQILATHSTIGEAKVEAAKKRILDINPNASVEIYKEFFKYETQGIIDDSIDYIVDCIDTVSSKIELVIRAEKMSIPIISCMGTGNKLDPTKFEITDIYKTSVCPLAKIMRKELKKRNIKKLKVLYSKEQPVELNNLNNKNHVPSSISFVPSVAGLIISGEIIKSILKL